MTGLNAIRDSLKVKILDSGKPYLPEPGTKGLDKEGLFHIWSAWYTDLDRLYPDLSALISPEEKHRAAGFKKTGDGKRYIMRHGFVRAVLGIYTHQAPEQIPIVEDRNGKPDLEPESNFTKIGFSLSSTDEMVCLGLARKSDIGLDIVKINPCYPFFAISCYLFTPGEREWIAQAVPDQRSVRFFRIWALKEALLKVTGGDVRIMKEADVSRIMTDIFLDGFYLVNIRETNQRCFIHESGCGMGHHQVITVLPKTKKDLDS
jgi:phosphopantetheinyl transferase